MSVQTFREVQAELDRLENPRRPVRLPEFAAVADLPSASRYRAGVAFVAAINMVVVSDGTAWRRLDTGATV